MEANSHTSYNQDDATRKLEESAIIERVARIVSSVRGAKPDYTRLAAELAQAIPFDVFGIVLLRHDRQAARLTICLREAGRSGENEHREVDGVDRTNEMLRWVMRHHQHPLKDSMLERMLDAREPLVLDYPEGLVGGPAECGDALSRYPQLCSVLITPLRVEGRVLGTLELGCMSVGMYAGEQLQRLVKAVAPVIATAIEGAQSGGSAEIQDRQREILKTVSSALTGNVDRASILRQIVSGIAQALNLASAIVTWNRSDGRLHLEAQSGLDDAQLSKILYDHFPVSDACIIGYSLRHRQPCVSPDIATDARFPATFVLYTCFGIHSVYSYPLISDSTTYGALLLCSHETDGFTPLKVDIISLFASQATIAIRSSLLLESLQQRMHFQEMIEQLEQTVEREEKRQEEPSLEAYTLLTQVQKETQRVFGVNFSTLLRLLSDHLLTRGERGLIDVLLSDNVVTASSYADNPQQVVYMADVMPFAEIEQSGKRATLSADKKVRTSHQLADSLQVLARTAEAALVRAGMLGELSELLIHLKQSANVVKDAWFIFDLYGNCIYMNPAAEILCNVHLTETDGYASLSILQIFAQILPYVRNRNEVSQYLQEIIRGNMTRQEQRCVVASHQVQEADGQMQDTALQAQVIPSTDNYYCLSQYPLRNEQEQLVGSALHMSDVTELVRDEKNRSALLSSVSHDLRTPLTIIKSAVTGLIQEGNKWSEQDRQAMLEDIDTETDHLTVLVNGIVELSRIEMGALTLEKEWCDMVEVVSGAIDKAQRILSERSIAMHVHIQNQLPLVFVDYVQIERVLYNLLEYAVGNSPTGSGIVLALDLVPKENIEQLTHQHEELGAVSQHSRDVSLLRIRVIDQGGKIPENRREAIFKSFSHMGSYKSTLSLAICKGIIDAHQGGIWVESAPKQLFLGEEAMKLETVAEGSCFTVVLPIHSEHSW